MLSNRRMSELGHSRRGRARSKGAGPDRGTAVARISLSGALSLTPYRHKISLRSPANADPRCRPPGDRYVANGVIGSGSEYSTRQLVDNSASRQKRCRSPARTEQGIMNPVKALENHGQAVWLDFLARGFVAKGDLKKLIDSDGVKGVTSNPSIFEKAIGSSDEYDGAIGEAVKKSDRPRAGVLRKLPIEGNQH